MAETFRRHLGTLRIGEVLTLALLSGISEELFFRGVLQAALGLVPASLIFGAIHIGPGRAYLPWTGFAIVMGFVLGLLYQFTGDLLAPVVAHATINALNLSRMQRLPSQDEDEGDGGVGGDGA